MANIDHLRSELRKLNTGAARVFAAPGRVNLIGEHTDYSDGFVMPAAVHFYTFVAAAPRQDSVLRLRSIDFNETHEFDLSQPPPGPTGRWSDYARGVAHVLKQNGARIGGADMAIKGEVPLGAGLSSSAAIEVATGFALLSLAGATISLPQLALACQQAEHQYVGTRCGIMDQFISCCGRAGHALELDCRSLASQALPIAKGISLVVCNTMVKHELAGGEYNARREECEAGVAVLRKLFPQRKIQALRDVTADDLAAAEKAMPAVVFRRCRHVVSENERVQQASAMLKSGDLKAFGTLMAASHQSLRDDFEVSCPELDFMVESARPQPGVLGARMTGGGFGGCTINLVEAGHAAGFQQRVAEEYEKKFRVRPEIYICQAAQGVHEVTSAATEAQ